MIESNTSTEDLLMTLLRQVFAGLVPEITDAQPLMDLTMPQFRVLMGIHCHGPLRMSDIASTLAVGTPTITSLVGKLEEKGLVKRIHSTQDRRVVFCSTTELGRTQAEQVITIQRDIMHRTAANLTDDEVRRVVDGLECLARAVEQARTSVAVQAV